MIDHAFFVKTSPAGRKSKIHLRLCAHRAEFLASLLEFTGEDFSGREDCGVSVQFENAQTKVDGSIIYLNLETVDIETIGHEIRHALFWSFSDASGRFTLKVLDGEEEEHFNALVDDFTLHAVKFTEQRLGHTLDYIHERRGDRHFQSPMPDEVRILLDE